MKKIGIALLLFVMIFSSVSLMEGRAVFDITETKSKWQSAVYEVRKSDKWQIMVGMMTGHGVGRVFKPNGNWASGLFTYSNLPSGPREPKPYYKTKMGEKIIWKMRKDTDYAELFKMIGSFVP